MQEQKQVTATEELLDTIKKLPGYVFELSADFGSGRNFSIRGNFGVGESLETMNAEMDKLVRVCDRQLSKAVIANIEEDLFKHEKMLEKAIRDYQAMEGRREGHKTLPATEKAAQENQKATVEELKAMIARKKLFLEKTKKDAE
jgi:hypothetical protein